MIVVSDLGDSLRPRVIMYLRRLPYRNAIPLSNVTQLYPRCDVVVAHTGDFILGILSYYRDLPFCGLTFVVEYDEALPLLLVALVKRAPKLRASLLVTVVPEQRADQLANHVTIVSQQTEWQLVVEPETLRPLELSATQRLCESDIPAMNELAALCGLVAWRPEVFSYGPAFGAFVKDQLVAMATTHFATPDVIEIGNIATHPGYRRQGFARACTSALVQAGFALAPRVYLLVMEENVVAFEAYRKLGFWPLERFAFTTFRLRE